MKILLLRKNKEVEKGKPVKGFLNFVHRILQQIRLHQWVKNLLVFTPMLAAHRLEGDLFQKSFQGFLALSFVASGCYAINDLFDCDQDREHPWKKNRPFCSGKISLWTLLFLMLGLFGLGALFSWGLSFSFQAVLLGYVGLSLSYSLVFKKWLLMDVIFLAGLYSLRIFAGAQATQIYVSKWLLTFSMFLFLSLALVKRYVDLKIEVPHLSLSKGRGYVSHDLAILPIMGITSGFLASLVMALYIDGEPVNFLYSHPFYLWFLCPLILYWVGRIWILSFRGILTGDPILFMSKDVSSYWVLLLSTVLITLAL